MSTDTSDTHQPGELATLLRELRGRAQRTQEELAELAGVSARLVSDLERGVIRRPRRDTVRMLIEALDLTPEAAEAFTEVAHGRRRPAPEGRLVRGFPVPQTRIVGRDRELGAAAALLDRSDVQLLTVVGPGGVGKTRLAVEVAMRSSSRFAEGAVFVDLTSVREPRDVADAIARALGLSSSGERAEMEQVVKALDGRRTLVVLDNMEHVVAAAAEIGELARRCPELAILATSRVPLRIEAETTLDLAPLAVPDPKRDLRPDRIEESPAVTLLVERARTGRPDFAVNAENATAVAEIVRRLDGLPLAIELAAPRLRMLSSASLLARLQERLPLLSGARRDAPARQQSLRDTIAWSVDLLDQVERSVFVRLAVFSGGWTFEAAERVVGDVVSGTILLDVIDALLDHHLVRPLPSVGEQPRLTMLDTIREFALDELERVGATQVALGRHADWCLGLVEPLEPELWTGRAPAVIPVFEAELDNLRAAFAWAAGHGDEERAIRLANATCRFLHDTGRARESREWLECALELHPGPNDPARANGLSLAGNMAFMLGDYEASERRQQEALDYYESVGDRWNIAGRWCDLGLAADGAGNLELAAERYARSLAMWRELDVRSRVGWLQTNLGVVRMLQGNQDQALESFTVALEIACLEDDRRSQALVLSNIGACRLAEGDLREAGRIQAQALALRVELGQPVAMERSIRELGFVAAASNRLDVAATLLGNAETLRIEFGTPIVGSDEATYRRWLERVESGMERHQLERWWSLGKQMPVGEACELALSLADELTLTTAATITSPDSTLQGNEPPSLPVG